MDVKVKTIADVEYVCLSAEYELKDALHQIPSKYLVEYVRDHYMEEFSAPALADFSVKDMLDHITDDGDDNSEILEYFKGEKLEVPYSENSDIINFEDCRHTVLCDILSINYIASYESACEALKFFFPH